MRKPPESADTLDLLFTAVAAAPSRPAVKESGSEVSYGEFGDRVRCLAGLFSNRREHPKIAIALPQGAWAYAAMFATRMAGGVYAPINVEHPLARQLDAIGRFAPDIILAPRGSLDAYRGALPDRLVVDAEEAARTAAPLTEARPAHPLAYVMFTSGSTGVPKGVMVSRAALEHYARWIIPTLDASADDVVSQHPNIAFDVSVMEIYGGLCRGACLVPIVSAKDRLLPATAIRDNGITLWVSVPSVVDLMRRSGQTASAYLGMVRRFIFCGEPLLPSHLESLFAACPGTEVINTYGPTEATVSCTARIMAAADYRAACRTTVALGPAIPGMTVTLVGGETAEEGEIVLSGPQLADGYWEDPVRSAESFRVTGGIRSYHTGDWGKRIDGELYFESRIDRQVKLRGARFELGEIDAALRKAGAVAAYTLLDKPTDGPGELVSFLEPAPGFDSAAAMAQLRTELPHYALPSRLILLDSLPRSANDKIDHRAMQELLRTHD